MKTWKKIFIVALSVLAACLLTIIIGTVVNYCEMRGYHHRWAKESALWVSENIKMERDYDYVRLKDNRTGKYTTPKLHHIYINEYDSDSIVVFQKKRNGQRGYINLHTGRIVIKPQFEKAWNFSEGIAATYQDGIITFIREDGTPAFTTTFKVTLNGTSSFQYHYGYCVMSTPEGKWGLIDRDGNWHVQPIYNAINAPYHGFRTVTDGEKFGLMTYDGNMVLPMEYDAITRAPSHEGFYLSQNGLRWEVNYDMQVTKPFVHDGIHLIRYIDEYIDVDYYYTNLEEEEKEDIDLFRFELNNSYGVIDANGKVILPAKYSNICRVNDHLLEAKLSGTDDAILFDTKGRMVAP